MSELNGPQIQAHGLASLPASDKALAVMAYLILSWSWMRCKIWSKPRKKLLFYSCCLTFLLTCNFAHALEPNRKISQYAHSAWRIQDGFFPGLPRVITQTVDGYIWIGTQAGIVRFDGVRFVQWSPPGEERHWSPSVTALRGTSDGSLWIGTADGDLWQWKNQKLISYPNLSSSLISAILEDERGTVWVTRARLRDKLGAICEVNRGHSQCYNPQNEVPNYGLYELAKDGAGNLWLGGDTEFIKWKPRSSIKETFRISGSVPDASVIGGLTVATDGSVWIGVNMAGRRLGLEHFIHGTLRPLKTERWDSSSIGVWKLLQDRQGALWVATINKGLYRIQNGDIDHIDSADGLTGDRVMSLLEDHEGDIWVATTKGIDCFRDLAVTTFSAKEGLSTQEVDAVVASRSGTIWAGGSEGLDALDSGNITSFRTGNNLPGEQVTSLMEDHAGRLWVGIDHTMSILKNGRFVPIKRQDGSPLGFVVGMAEDTDGNVWVETSGSPRELIRLRDLQVKEILPAPQMPAARPVAADPHGGIWLGLMNGDLARYREGKLDIFRFLHKKQELVNQVDAWADGSVVGATAFGLLGWRQGIQQILTTQNGLPCDGVNSFIRDNEGGIWLSLQCGLVRISSQDFQKWWGHPDIKLPLRLFDSLDGVQPGLSPFQGAARAPDGKLWFANDSVLQVIDPVHIPNNSISPPVHVEELQANAKHFGPRADLRLPALTRDIVIRYTALSYIAPQKVLFRYILEGQDKTWVDAGTRREAFYTNLGPGAYRFHVIACNNDGVWNETGAALDFSIDPAFYQTVWFKLLCLIVVVGILWLLYFLRMRQVAAGAQARLEERLEERERIARELHDTLLQGVQGLILRFQAISNRMPKKDATRGMMEQVLDRADEVLVEGRRRVRNLRSEEPGVELSEALALYVREFAQDHNVGVSINAVGTPRELNAIVREEVFRIGREALVNALQHSKASRIEAEIIYENANMYIRVRDNGCGIDAAMLNRGRPGHWGIPGMRERAKKLGAELNIWSSPRAGTEIELIVPASVAYGYSPPQRHEYWLKRVIGRWR